MELRDQDFGSTIFVRSETRTTLDGRKWTAISIVSPTGIAILTVAQLRLMIEQTSEFMASGLDN